MKHVVELKGSEGLSFGFAVFDTEEVDLISPVFETEEEAKEFLSEE